MSRDPELSKTITRRLSQANLSVLLNSSIGERYIRKYELARVYRLNSPWMHFRLGSFEKK